MNKKGISEVVTAILIILLVLGAVVIVWQVVRGTVESGASQVTSKAVCIGIDLSLQDVKCTSAGVVTGIVKRGADNALGIKMKVILGASAGSAITAPAALASVELTDLSGASTGDLLRVAVVLSDNTVCDPIAEKTLTCV